MYSPLWTSDGISLLNFDARSVIDGNVSHGTREGPLQSLLKSILN